MDFILPEGWTAEEIRKGKIAVWDAKGNTKGIWRKSVLQKAFAPFFTGLFD